MKHLRLMESQTEIIYFFLSGLLPLPFTLFHLPLVVPHQGASLCKSQHVSGWERLQQLSALDPLTPFDLLSLNQRWRQCCVRDCIYGPLRVGWCECGAVCVFARNFWKHVLTAAAVGWKESKTWSPHLSGRRKHGDHRLAPWLCRHVSSAPVLLLLWCYSDAHITHHRREFGSLQLLLFLFLCYM